MVLGTKYLYAFSNASHKGSLPESFEFPDGQKITLSKEFDISSSMTLYCEMPRWTIKGKIHGEEEGFHM